MLAKLYKKSSFFISFLQSILLTSYVFLVGSFIVNGDKWFGPMNKFPIVGPVLVLTLFIFSALISASLVLFFPFYIFWFKKDLNKAIKILFQTILWLIFYFVILLSTFMIF